MIGGGRGLFGVSICVNDSKKKENNPRTCNFFSAVPTLVEIGPTPLEAILEFCQSIFAISLLTLLEKQYGPLYKQT